MSATAVTTHSSIMMQPYEVIDVQSPLDTDRCYVTASHILPDDRLIVADYYNKCAKLFDTRHKLTDTMWFAGIPQDIAVVGDDEVIVIIKNKDSLRQIQRVLVYGRTLMPGQSFLTKHRYRCPAYFGERLYVTDYEDETIKVLDMTGKILKTIENGTDWPQCLAVSTCNRVLYVSNPEKGMVKCMTLDGEILAVDKYGESGYRDRLAVHPDGSVYVCSWKSDNIRHITSQCTHIETLLDHGEVDKTICINATGDRLYIADSTDHSNVKIFKIGD